MSKFNKTKKYIAVGSVLFLFPIGLLLFFGIGGKHRFATLPYYSSEYPKGAETGNYVLPPFSFENQDGTPITNDSLKGKIWIATFYNLESPYLAKITERLLNINFRYREDEDVRIVVFSTNCDVDTQPRRLEYISANSQYNRILHKWDFLASTQKEMQQFLHTGFFIEDIHNEAIFRLVDGEGHIRGLYGNTEYHIQDAISDIALLRKEVAIKERHEKQAKNQ